MSELNLRTRILDDITAIDKFVQEVRDKLIDWQTRLRVHGNDGSLTPMVLKEMLEEMRAFLEK